MKGFLFNFILSTYNTRKVKHEVTKVGYGSIWYAGYHHNPSTWEDEDHEFETSLGYIVSASLYSENLSQKQTSKQTSKQHTAGYGDSLF